MGAENVAVYEANPALIPIIESNFRRNKTDAISLHNAAVVGSTFQGDTIEFNVHENFWSSSLISKAGDKTGIKATAMRIDDIVAKEKPNALIMDVEGAEYDILMQSELQGIEKISAEFHTRYIGSQKATEIISHLISKGFTLDLEKSYKENMVFFRETSNG